MDRLEDFIKKNKPKFDSEEIDPKVWDRITSQQKGNIKPMPKRRNGYTLLKLAASFLILALAGYGGFKLLSDDTPPSTTIATQLPSEVLELDNFYEAKVAGYIKQVDASISDPELLASIHEELSILSDEKKELFNEFGNELDNAQIIEALVKTYKMKLQILQNILNLLRENNEDNNHKQA